MKNVAKCDTWCELQNPVNHRVFERKVAPEAIRAVGHASPGCHTSFPQRKHVTMLLRGCMLTLPGWQHPPPVVGLEIWVHGRLRRDKMVDEPRETNHVRAGHALDPSMTLCARTPPQRDLRTNKDSLVTAKANREKPYHENRRLGVRIQSGEGPQWRTGPKSLEGAPERVIEPWSARNLCRTTRRAVK
ncbi:hypothetical protein GmHk_U060198 [Glycine max]|nr:hypothetical protein GmHk_U060198 [Glycine max]